MAKVALNGLDIISGTQRCNRITVSEIVKSCVRPANGCYDFFEISYHSLGNQIPTQLVCKNQIQRIGPSGSLFLLMFILLEFPVSQQLHNPGAGIILRGLSFFRETKRNCPPGFFSFWSCLLIRMVPLIKSTRSQVRPRASPSRMPVNSVIVYRSSGGCPLAASITITASAGSYDTVKGTPIFCGFL